MSSFRHLLFFLFMIHSLIGDGYSQSGSYFGELVTGTVVNGSVQIDDSPLAPFVAPKLQAINLTAADEWYMDGVSEDGLTGVSILFARDDTLSPYGLPMLRASLDCVWPNGTKFTTMMFANTSIVYEQDGYIYGQWIAPDWSANFTTSIDNQRTDVDFDHPLVQGHYHVQSFTRAHYVNAYTFPNALGNTLFAPMIYWNEPIPAGKHTANFTISGTQLQFAGYGGFDRNWHPYSYDYFASKWRWTRTVLGPYTIIWWVLSSSIDGNDYASAFIFENGTSVFETTDATTVNVSATYEDGIHGQFQDLSTGFDVIISGRNQTWTLQYKHVNVLFESDKFASNNQYSRFTNVVTGGLTGGHSFAGVAVNEQGFIVNHLVPA